MFKKTLNNIQLDLLKRHIGPFLFCFLTLMFLLLLQFLILHIDKLIGKDIPISVITDLIFTNLAYMVVLAAPMAVLVATLMAFGKFSELNELTSIRASGVHPLTVISPVLFASILMCAGLIWFSNNVLPEANHKSRSLFIDIRLKKPGFDLKPNEFYTGIDGYTFLVDRIDSETDSLYEITLFQDATRTTDQAYITAEKGILLTENEEMLTLYLTNGVMQKYPKTSNRNKVTIEKTNFKNHRITFDLADLAFEKSDPNRRNRSDRTMNIQAMQIMVDSLNKEIDDQYFEALNFNLTVPRINKFTERRGRKRTLDDVAEKDSILITSLIVLDNLPGKSEQQKILKNAISDLKTYKSAFQNTQANVRFREKSINRYLVEIHKKFSIPFSCIVFVLLGAPIGIMTRRGNFGIAAIISAVILTIYWISLIQGEKLADRLFVTPIVGMWAFNTVFSIIGIVLLVKLTTETKLISLFRKDG